MARYLAYTSPARGHLYPLMATLLELQKRGHEVHVRTLASQVAALRSLGLHADRVDPAIEEVPLDSWQASTPQEGIAGVLETFAKRAAHEVPDLQQAISEVGPDALVVDITAVGAAAVTEASSIPWAQSIPYFMFSQFSPGGPAQFTPAPFSLDPAGVDLLNAPRLPLGLSAITGADDMLRARLYLYYTAPPFEPGHTLPSSFRMVGPGLWDPPGDTPGWFDDLDRPVVMVTASSEYQRDDALVAAALGAVHDENVRVVVTTAAHDPGDFPAPASGRVVRFLSHGPLLKKAACVVCQGGMGITQKALAAGVPVCVVPFGRDQFDVAERVVATGAGTRVLPWELTPESLGTAIRQAMDMRPGAQRVATGLARAGGAPAAADALESLVATAPLPAHVEVGGHV
ncbi:MAG: glycosyltransferase [Candidatus Dormibacteria bacterium]